MDFHPLLSETLGDEAPRDGADGVVLALGDSGEFSSQPPVDAKVEGRSGARGFAVHDTD
jgi:hypothetical protein